jgi:hypothetical protein
VGCFANRPGGAGVSAGLVAAVAKNGAESLDRFAAPDPATIATEVFGTVRMTVKWPPGDAESPDPFSAQSARRRVQLIPTTTQALVVTISDSGGKLAIPPFAVARPPGAATSSISLRVPENPNLSVDVTAYRDVPPDLTGFAGAGATAIARATLPGVIVRRSVDTNLKLTLVSLFVPSLGAMSTNVGAAGKRVLFSRGRNLTRAAGAKLEISFNGVPASLAMVDDATLIAEIPAGATTGPVTVVNDGVPAANNPVFWTIDKFEAAVDTPPIDGQPVLPGRAYYGAKLNYQATYNFLLSQGATFDPAPQPIWTIANNPLAGTNTLATSSAAPRLAVLTAAPIYATGSVTVALGEFHSVTLPAEAIGVDTVFVNPRELEMNAAPAAGGPSLAFQGSSAFQLSSQLLHTLPFDRGLAWTSSDETRVKVDATGRLTAQPDAPKGKVVITATSRTDPAKKATVSVDVTIFGNLGVGVR